MKRTIYLTLSAFLGLLVSGIVHAIVEIVYLAWAVKNNKPVTWHTYGGRFPCSLHPILFWGLPIAGIIGGFFTGRIWWRWVYVEGRHWRRRKQ